AVGRGERLRAVLLRGPYGGRDLPGGGGPPRRLGRRRQARLRVGITGVKQSRFAAGSRACDGTIGQRMPEDPVMRTPNPLKRRARRIARALAALYPETHSA